MMNPTKGMDEIEVIARFDRNGGITPLEITWRGRKYKVASSGRRWEDDDGQHFMVMVAGEQVFELLFIPDEMCWFIKGSKHALA
jgi:hypothetical protein